MLTHFRSRVSNRTQMYSTFAMTIAVNHPDPFTEYNVHLLMH